MRVLYFARSRELMGRSQQEVQLDAVRQWTNTQADASAASASQADGSTASTAAGSAAASPSVSQLLSYLVHQHPALQPLVACTLLALNQQFVHPTSTDAVSYTHLTLPTKRIV